MHYHVINQLSQEEECTKSKESSYRSRGTEDTIEHKDSVLLALGVSFVIRRRQVVLKIWEIYTFLFLVFYMKMNYMKQTNASKLLSVEHSVSTETAGDCCFLFAMQSYPKAKARAANIENQKQKERQDNFHCTISKCWYSDVYENYEYCNPPHHKSGIQEIIKLYVGW